MGIERSIRNKRFKVKDPGSATLVISNILGDTITLDIFDCSLTGLLATSKDTSACATLAVNDIIPAAKIVAKGSEISLGRLVIKRVSGKEPVEIALSCIDMRIPIDGVLSSLLAKNFDSKAREYDFELGSDHFNIAHFVESEYANSDMFDRMSKFGVFFRDWSKSDKFAYYFQRKESFGSRVDLVRKRGNGRNDYIMMGSNDYLGLAGHPKVQEAVASAVKTYGFGSTGTPPTSGHSDLHEKLMESIAHLFGRQAAVLFSSGFSTNVGAISAICREGDLIVADVLSHASIQDGITMSRATARFFKHNDMDHLEKILSEMRDKYNGCLIATEGAFSMDGTIGKLDEIHRLARKYNARYYIDQAHCLGVVGKTGLGTVEKYNLVHDADIVMGLFSKALGGVGGFVTGSKDLCDWLKVFSRSYLFATSMPPSNCAGILAALDLMKTEGGVQKLQGNIKHFREGLRYLGADISPGHETSIFPVEIRDESKMGIMFQSFLNDGIFVLPVVYPVVSRNRCRFRFSVRADHSVTDMDFVINALEKAMLKANITFGQVNEMGQAQVRTVNELANIPIKKAV